MSSSSSSDHLNTVSRSISTFVRTKRFYYIYPIILFVGVSLNYILPSQYLNSLKSSYIVSSKNRINQIFAYEGNKIFNILFVGLFVVKLLSLTFTDDFHLKTIQSRAFLINSIFTFLKQFLVRFAFKYGFLMGLFHLIDTIFLNTGGSCHVTEAVSNALAQSSKTIEQCSSYNGIWVQIESGVCYIIPKHLASLIKSEEVCKEYGEWKFGFDVSGHFCFLVTISLILWNELSSLEFSGVESTDLESQQKSFNSSSSIWFKINILNLWRWLILTSLVIWSFLLLITSLFYHTAAEKFAGLVLGYITPLTIYFLIPCSSTLNNILS